jgi:hypothetical protein
MRQRNPHNPETYKQAIVGVINLIAVKKVKLNEISKTVSRQYKVTNYLCYILKNINVINMQDDYAVVNPDWILKLSLNPKQTIDEIYQLCREYSNKIYKEGNQRAKERKLEEEQRKLEEQKQTQLQLQTPAVPSINEWLNQLPIEEIIKFVQSKNYIVLRHNGE